MYFLKVWWRFLLSTMVLPTLAGTTFLQLRSEKSCLTWPSRTILMKAASWCVVCNYSLLCQSSWRLLCLQIAKPKPLPLWTVPIQPFNLNLWLAVIATAAICLTFVFIYGQVDPRKEVLFLGQKERTLRKERTFITSSVTPCLAAAVCESVCVSVRIGFSKCQTQRGRHIHTYIFIY
jgi:hypothetical protein